MEKWITYDYYIQLSCLIMGITAAFIGVFLGVGFILFYFIVGIPQLISFFIKALQQKKKSIVYIVYGIGIIPVWLSVAVVGLNPNDNDVTNFFGFILIAALIYSPVLAFLYTYETYKIYQSLKHTK
ncbi:MULTISPECIES: hypothetical protein [Chryseobacterium]|uniref:hypothetical protein n=1 Tax=Chryseobacterium TaxID=59732 RepID=UPI001BEA6C9B|nr:MULTISPECIES: hypothetical protein [Chryseobacterium]MBT2622478.1 hypothetical protein [Chryseobacterium sp. ISL-6]